MGNSASTLLVYHHLHNGTTIYRLITSQIPEFVDLINYTTVNIADRLNLGSSILDIGSNIHIYLLTYYFHDSISTHVCLALEANFKILKLHIVYCTASFQFPVTPSASYGNFAFFKLPNQLWGVVC